MGLFHCDCKEKEEEIKRLLNIIEIQAQTILNLSKPQVHPVSLLLINQINKNPIMAVEILANQEVIATLSLNDSVTNAPVPATFQGTAAVSDNPAVATASVLPDGTVEIVGVSAGTCNVTVTSNASFTNSLGVATTGSVSASVAVTIDAVPVADGVVLILTFGTPTNQ